jgi:hypothetical protein
MIGILEWMAQVLTDDLGSDSNGCAKRTEGIKGYDLLRLSDLRRSRNDYSEIPNHAMSMTLESIHIGDVQYDVSSLVPCIKARVEMPSS